MSAQPAIRLLQDQEILGELLHSLSQPLTTLCCSLELSMEKAAGQQHEAVSAALEQAERVISQVRLLREYLDAELSVPTARPVEFASVVNSVVGEFSSVAAVHQIKLQIEGASPATIAVTEARLRLALQYLLAMLVEEWPAGSAILLRLEERAGETVLHAEVENPRGLGSSSPSPEGETHDRMSTASRKVKLAIAGRVLEAAGASLTVGGAASPFVIRIPRLSAHPV